MRFRSVRFKMSLLYTAILGIILLAYSLMLYYNLNHVIFQEIDANLQKKLRQTESIISLYAKTLEANKDDASLSLRRALHLEEQESNEIFQWPSVKKLDQMWRYTIQALGIKSDYIIVYATSGEIIEQSNNIDPELRDALQNNLRMTPTLRTSVGNLILKDRELRVITHPLSLSGKIKYIIQLATLTETHKVVQRNRMKLILITIPLFLIATSSLGVFFVNHILKPVKQITQAAQQISHKDLDKRIQLEHKDEEIRSLVDAFNDMISRLEKSFHHVEEFSSNVAHELKTPLAIIRGELEVALRKERSAQEYQRSIQVALEEIQRVLKTVNDLLLLAKLDFRTEVMKFEPVELNEFLEEIHEQSKFMAAEKKINISLKQAPSRVVIKADKLHLRRLFFNLIDNGIKFTNPGGRIDIRVTPNSERVEIAIKDNGAGIKKEDLPKIFNRFFYSESLSETSLSTGLGLSLVQSIAKAHNGAVSVSSQFGHGSTFTVTLPRA